MQTNRTELSSLVNQQQIDSLPINGRNFISFSVITPGVTTDRTPQQGSTLTSGLSFTGQRARSNNIMVDGLDNNDLVVGAVRATFSQEAIREFQVLTRLLLGRVRQGLRRRRQHRDQERHQRPARQRVSLLSRREPQRQELLRAVRHLRQPGRPARSARTARSSGAPRLAVPCARTGRSSSCRSSSTDITDNRVVTIDPDRGVAC